MIPQYGIVLLDGDRVVHIKERSLARTEAIAYANTYNTRPVWCNDTAVICDYPVPQLFYDLLGK